LGGRLHRVLRARDRLPAARPGEHRARARGSRGPPPRSCLCLAPMADELKPAYLLAGTDRPKIDRALERLRRRFEPDAIEFLSAAEASGEDVVAACNALGLFAYAGRLIVVEGAGGWNARDAKGARDLAGVLVASESMLERSGDPHSRTIPRLLGVLGNHVSSIQECQTLEASGVSAKDAAVRLKRNPYYVGKLYAQARNFSPDELRQVTVRLADLDHALKGGSRLAPELELERALVEITRPREAPARA